jgi:hypothetical protein
MPNLNPDGLSLLVGYASNDEKNDAVGGYFEPDAWRLPQGRSRFGETTV